MRRLLQKRSDGRVCCLDAGLQLSAAFAGQRTALPEVGGKPLHVAGPEQDQGFRVLFWGFTVPADAAALAHAEAEG